MSRVLFGSKNKSKVEYYKKLLEGTGYEVIGLDEFDNENLDVVEDGKNPEENSIIKALAYFKMSKLPTFAVDYGLYIDKFSDDKQPGNDVRRVGGIRLTDQEMLDYYKSELEKVGGESDGKWTSGIAVVDENGVLKSHSFEWDTFFTTKESEIRNEDEPFNSIQFVKKFGKYKSEMTKSEMSMISEEKSRILKEYILNCLN